MEGPSLAGYVFFFLFFHMLSGFSGFPVAVPVSIASVDANIISIVLNFVFWGPAPEVSFFFFLQHVAGLTSRVPVRDSRAGAPLGHDAH